MGVLRAGQVFDGERLTGPGEVRWEGDRLTLVGAPETGRAVEGQGAGGGRREPCLELPAGWTVAPGFVDVHCHGGGGAAFTEGAEAVRRAVGTHRRAGTTSVMASTVTAPLPALREQLAVLGEAVVEGDLLGVHLEGPWLAPGKAGAHDPGLLRAPDVAEFDAMQAAAGGTVRMVTVAPEPSGGEELVRHLAERGVVAAVGHTEATLEEARRALGAGASAFTHLFNAMRPLHHREPGPVLTALQDDRAWVELIADGVHLAPDVLGWALRALGERAVLVSDAMAAAGAPDGDYRLGSLDVRVEAGVARLAPGDGDAGGGAIAGSTLTLERAVRFAIEGAGVEPVAALRAATSAPAAMVGAADVGHLRPGAWADLVVLDAGWTVRGVLRHGQWVRPREVPGA
ncbi:N-acetylglucosamine-6-phosphate deacetylase [Kytococcus aerolatus]|uniref:N-acetylglucosamine-6-phosphate deacetylase n=1 Tax=Kytococcus aerolatus TaxID=592308 RepID=A0A212T5G4_9MICO|nr:N-acetylglucosamine-6-phosphate deacetylase [Kytococcus aerolatus]